MSDKASEVDELEQLFADADAMPIQISYALIKSITKNFAQVLGNGAFGVVYLGGLRNGMVAVKKLSISMDFSDTQFLEEVKCLKRVRHKNIVRFLGYCADTHGEVMEIEGKLRIVEVQQRLLCFEYVPNGSLHQCLQEKTHGYDWNTCYRIIKGICQGLHFLHEERISHLDLKPANVLLGAHMEPKITDFGLSRLLDGNHSTVFTMNLFGTPGYIAPELIDKQKISLKSDIFSLGIIIERLLTGIYENITETWLESLCVECKKMKRCLEISEKCANSDPSKIPTVDKITLTLNQTATTIQRVPPVVTDPRNDLTSSLYKWLKSQCVDCRQRKRCLQIAEKCADSDLSERPTVEKIFHMLNETQTTTQRIPSTVNEPRNDPRSSLYQWLKSLCVDCKRKKESLEIAEKSANPDPSERPSRDDIIGMLNETETTIRKVLGVVDEPINHPRSSLYEWLKSQCVECNQKKGFFGTVEKCAIPDPGKIPSIAELILMLNETETTIPKIHPVVRERREDTKSSLYQWLQSLCVDCRDVKRCLETAEKFSNPGPSEGPNVENIFLILNEAQTPPKVAGVKDINNTKSSLYQCNSDPSERPTMAEITLMHNEIETTIPKVSPDVNELENDARELYKWLQSLCVYFKRLKRCVEITKMCADRDPSKRPTVEEMFLMLNGTQTMRQKVLPVATAPRNDTRSSLYRWLESLCVDCNEKKRFLEIAEKFANFDGPKRPTVDEINVMLNKPETMFPKVPRNDQQSLLYPWLVESLCANCKQKKRCLEIAKMCAHSDPHRRPTMAEVIIMLNETETMIQTVPPVVIVPRKNPRSSLYQVVERFRALPTQTLREYSRFTDLYKDLSVLEHVLEGSEKPSKLPYPLFQFITENFSDDRRIGHNELGEYFKGVMQVVAVTKVHGSLNISDVIFHHQIGKMMTAKHPNIIRFLGYCSDVAEQELVMDGEVTTAEKWERLLCFEYLCNGNLSKHISDELSGLEWHTRYQIIKGICEGLSYLHKEKFIVHMDLKPASILLDDDMVPKITDFGISEIFRFQGIITLISQPTGGNITLQSEYSAPEINFGGSITSRKVDIYSLGVIIIELVTGSKKKPSIANVLRRWEQRWNGSSKCTPLRHQVIRCLELAESCLNKDPNRRPFAWDIIHALNKMVNEANAYR